MVPKVMFTICTTVNLTAVVATWVDALNGSRILLLLLLLFDIVQDHVSGEGSRSYLQAEFRSTTVGSTASTYECTIVSVSHGLQGTERAFHQNETMFGNERCGHQMAPSLFCEMAFVGIRVWHYKDGGDSGQWTVD